MLSLEKDGAQISPSEYLESCLDGVPIPSGASERTVNRIQERNDVKASLRNLFRERRLDTLVRPVHDENELRNAGHLLDEDLRPEFLQQVSSFRDSVFRHVRAKELFGSVMNGSLLADMLGRYVDSLNGGLHFEIRGAFQYAAENALRASHAAASAHYSTALENIVREDDGSSSLEDFNDTSREAWRLAMDTFEKAPVNSCGIMQKLQAELRDDLQQRMRKDRDLAYDRLLSLSKSRCESAFEAAWGAVNESCKSCSTHAEVHRELQKLVEHYDLAGAAGCICRDSVLAAKFAQFSSGIGYGHFERIWANALAVSELRASHAEEEVSTLKALHKEEVQKRSAAEMRRRDAEKELQKESEKVDLQRESMRQMKMRMSEMEHRFEEARVADANKVEKMSILTNVKVALEDILSTVHLHARQEEFDHELKLSKNAAERLAEERNALRASLQEMLVKISSMPKDYQNYLLAPGTNDDGNVDESNPSVGDGCAQQ